MKQTGGIQLPPIMTLDDARMAIQQIQDYLNSGVEIVKRSALENVGAVFGPKSNKGDQLCIASGEVKWTFTTQPAPGAVFPYQWGPLVHLSGGATDYGGAGAKITIDHAYNYTGNPRFTDDNYFVVSCIRSFTPTGNAEDFPMSPPISQTKVSGGANACGRESFYLYFPWDVSAKGGFWWTATDSVTVGWLAIGYGRGEK